MLGEELDDRLFDELDTDDVVAVRREEREIFGLTAQRDQDPLPAIEPRHELLEERIRMTFVKSDLVLGPACSPKCGFHGR
ncbi:MAG: hypothetical protein QM831_41975 [Kofleriaceae bacterium]